jgi:hypothetical protein
MAFLNPLTVLVMVFAFLGVIFLITTIVGIKRRRVFAAVVNCLILLLMLALSALSGVLSISLQGYRALVKEEIAAIVQIDPLGKHKFRARISMPSGSDKIFFLSGDQLYVDAHILKWKPVANLFGLHTSYELDRVAGRYVSLQDEANKPRTVYSLSKYRWLNMFEFRRRFAALSLLLDAQYGSATYIHANSVEEVKILVSTTGLLIRKSDKKPDL